MFNDYESIAQIAPGGDFFETEHDQLRQPAPARWAAWPTIGCDASGKSPPARRCPMYIGRRNVEGGGRQQSFANDGVPRRGRRAWRDQRGLGLRRVGAVLDRAAAEHVTLNYFVDDRVVTRALDVHVVGGVPTCQSVIDGT